MIDVDNRGSDNYDIFLETVLQCFVYRSMNGEPLFYTNADDLFSTFIQNVPADARNHYNCYTCRDFINKYGRLAYVDASGNIVSAVWEIVVPSFFRKAVDALSRRVACSDITSIFDIRNEPDKTRLGVKSCGGFNHISLMVPSTIFVPAYEIEPDGGKERARLIRGSFFRYSQATFDKAYELIKANVLYRGDVHEPMIAWFSANKSLKKYARDGYWNLTAKSPISYSRIASSAIGIILDTIESGGDIDGAINRFNNYVAPENHQHAQAAPTCGALQNAEKGNDMKRFLNKEVIVAVDREQLPQFNEMLKQAGLKPYIGMKVNPDKYFLWLGNMIWSSAPVLRGSNDANEARKLAGIQTIIGFNRLTPLPPKTSLSIKEFFDGDYIIKVHDHSEYEEVLWRAEKLGFKMKRVNLFDYPVYLGAGRNQIFWVNPENVCKCKAEAFDFSETDFVIIDLANTIKMDVSGGVMSMKAMNGEENFVRCHPLDVFDKRLGLLMLFGKMWGVDKLEKAIELLEHKSK